MILILMASTCMDPLAPQDIQWVSWIYTAVYLTSRNLLILSHQSIGMLTQLSQLALDSGQSRRPNRLLIEDTRIPPLMYPISLLHPRHQSLMVQPLPVHLQCSSMLSRPSTDSLIFYLPDSHLDLDRNMFTNASSDIIQLDGLNSSISSLNSSTDGFSESLSSSSDNSGLSSSSSSASEDDLGDSYYY